MAMVHRALTVLALMVFLCLMVALFLMPARTRMATLRCLSLPRFQTILKRGDVDLGPTHGAPGDVCADRFKSSR
eukprot:11566141-Karenia_brevis.AAC.1